MNDEQLQQIPTADRYEHDLNDWTQLLQAIELDIDYAEAYGDVDFLRAARKKIADMLGEFEQARYFIQVKRSMAQRVTINVETLFVDDQSERRLEEDPYEQG